MENQLQANRPETLMSELGGWNRQESKFKEIFGEDALKDREFLKMKLEHYDRLYYKYNGRPQTQDERAMMTMLRFQRRKMERSLYPGLLRRLLHRGRSRIKAMWLNSRENSITSNGRQQAQNYIGQTLPVKESPRPQQRQEAVVRQMPVPRYGTNMRKKNRVKHKGQSIR